MEQTERFKQLDAVAQKFRKQKKTDRVKMHGSNILVAKPADGMTRRFVNDQDGGVEKMAEMGYTPVFDSSMKTSDKRIDAVSMPGSPVMRSVGGGVNALLMESPDQMYNERQKAKQVRIDASEQAMQIDDDNPTAGGQYGRLKIGENI